MENSGLLVAMQSNSRDPDDVSRVCETFDGVVVWSNVEGVEHARRLAAAAIYRLLKGLALERVLREGVWPGEKTRRYILEDRCQKMPTLCP